MSHQGWLTYEYRVAIADYLLRHELTGGAARILSTHEPAPATVTEVLRAETTAEHLARDMVRGVCQARRHGRAPQALVELVIVSREPCP